MWIEWVWDWVSLVIISISLLVLSLICVRGMYQWQQDLESQKQHFIWFIQIIFEEGLRGSLVGQLTRPLVTSLFVFPHPSRFELPLLLLPNLTKLANALNWFFDVVGQVNVKVIHAMVLNDADINHWLNWQEFSTIERPIELRSMTDHAICWLNWTGSIDFQLCDQLESYFNDHPTNQGLTISSSVSKECEC